jgi:hypothetical protein
VVLSVFAEIAALTDCDAIQEKFDIAAANHDRESAAGVSRLPFALLTTRYMDAADARTRAGGCYWSTGGGSPPCASSGVP